MKANTKQQQKIGEFVMSDEAAKGLRTTMAIAPCSSLQDSDFSELTMRPLFKRYNADCHGPICPDVRKRSETAHIGPAKIQQQVAII